MKALEILKRTLKTPQDLFRYSDLELETSIKELEELNNRSCNSCKCWDSVENSKIKTISYCRFLNTGTKNSFYCNEFEAKGE